MDWLFQLIQPAQSRLFGTARFGGDYSATGIRDQLDGRDYGRGFWSQQWLALQRMAGRA